MQLAALQRLIETNTVVLAIVFFGCVLLIWLFNMALAPSDSATKRRINSLMRQQDELRLQREARLLRKKQSSEKISKLARTVTEKSGLNKKEALSDLAAKLGQAGYRGQNAVFHFTALRVVMLVVLPFVTFLGLKLFYDSLDSLTTLLIPIAAGALGFLLPQYFLDRKARERINRIKRTFPDAIDMLVVCTESGLGTDSAIKRVSQEMYTGAPDIAEELAATLVELSFFEDRATAFLNMQKRIPLAYTRTFANTLIQTERFGTPIAQSLRILSDEFRKDRMEEAETRANKLASKMVLPIALFMFMPLLAIIMYPAIINVQDSGWSQ
jgi:tight adherence protein C